jgi:predicted secreted Zn-dependent protease
MFAPGGRRHYYYWRLRPVFIMACFLIGVGFFNVAHSECSLFIPPSLRKIFSSDNIRPYVIRGHSSQHITSAIKRVGPLDRFNVQRYAGYYRWFVTNREGYITGRYYVELPCLRNVTKSLRFKWRRYVRVLVTHEINHHNLFQTGLKHLKSQEPIDPEAYRSIIRNMRRNDLRFDALDRVTTFLEYEKS